MNKTTSLARSWVVCISASLFFFYEFIQMNMFNAISAPFMQDLHLNATQLGKISSFYFIANVIFLFFAGMLLDRFSSKKIILIALSICIGGTALFAASTHLAWASACRFLTGIGGAFCFLSVIRLATRWFPAARMALVIGVVVTMAMIGGMIAQTPLTLLVQAVNWRWALLIDACFGLVIFGLILILVQDFPPSYAEQHQREHQQIHQMGYWKSIRLAFLKMQNWWGGIYTCLMNLPLSLLGGIWGALYLASTHQLSHLQATYVTSMLFLGTIIGGPISGWISDRIRLRRLPMMIGAVSALILIFIIMLTPQLSLISLIILFLALGLMTSTQIIGYPTVAENSISAITAMSVSVVNIATMGGQAIFQPIFGRLMDWYAKMHHQTMGVYVSDDFYWAMYIFPVGFVVALVAVFKLRETYCRRREE